MGVEHVSKTSIKMRKYLRAVAERSLNISAAATRRSFAASGRQTRALVMAPAGTGSLGDEAMLRAILDRAQECNVSASLLEPFGDEHQPWDELNGVAARRMVINVDYPRGWRSWRPVPNILAGFDELLIVGADIIDGVYRASDAITRLHLARHADELGLKVTVAGFSISNRSHPEAISLFAALPDSVRCCLRDPISLERFKQLTGRVGDLVADLAFLLRPGDLQPDEPLFKWIGEQRQRGHLCVGLNLNSHALKSGREEDPSFDPVDVYVRVVEAMLAEWSELRLVIIPHDRRTIPGLGCDDFTLAEKAVGRLTPSLRERCSVMGRQCGSVYVKAIVGRLAVVITGRMHLAIAALGMGTPVAAVVYQGKFEGLFRHFGLEGCCIEPQELTSKKFLSLVQNQIRDENNSRGVIQEQLPRVMKLAESNLENWVCSRQSAFTEQRL